MNTVTPEQQAALDKAVEAMADAARDVIAACKEDETTQNGYGTLLAVITGGEGDQPLSKAKAQLLMLAMIKQGYPAQTIAAVQQIMGWA